MSDKIIFCDKVYFGDKMNKTKLNKLRKKIGKKSLLCGEYLIAIPENPHSQLDILSARQLVWDYYTRNPLRVVGVASDYNEALEIVEKIVRECLQTRGDLALKEYLTC